MKILITYSSKTGNTKRLAEGIYNNIQLSDVTLLPIHEVEEVESYESILVGYWVDKGGPNEEAAKFMEGIKGKKVGLFATLGAYPDSQHGWDSLLKGEALVKEENEVVGKYICQGAVDEKLIEVFRKFAPGNPHAITEAKLKRYGIAKQHPNKVEMESIAILFRERLV
ncbi:MAG: flavodoxin family protein [Niameybacter sp.]